MACEPIYLCLRWFSYCAILASMGLALAVFSRDLRLHDNPVLHAAVTASAQVIPVL
jgi:hypothetical protein